MADKLARFTHLQDVAAHADSRLLASALGLAAQTGNEALVLLLLKRGASTEQGCFNGLSLLGVAVHHGRISVVRALLAASADINNNASIFCTPFALS